MKRVKNLKRRTKTINPQMKRIMDPNHYLESGKPQEHPYLKSDRRKNPNVSHNSALYHSLINHSISGGPRVEVEYEQEVESVPLTRSALANW